ncbi:hypothetical protein CBL_09617 [Carabus blaptoides fortunei]
MQFLQFSYGRQEKKTHDTKPGPPVLYGPAPVPSLTVHLTPSTAEDALQIVWQSRAGVRHDGWFTIHYSVQFTCSHDILSDDDGVLAANSGSATLFSESERTQSRVTSSVIGQYRGPDAITCSQQQQRM